MSDQIENTDKINKTDWDVITTNVGCTLVLLALIGLAAFTSYLHYLIGVKP